MESKSYETCNHMQPLFCYPEKVFCKNRDWEKAIVEEVLCLGSNTPQVPSWVTGNSAILGGVGILQKTCLEPRDPL